MLKGKENVALLVEIELDAIPLITYYNDIYKDLGYNDLWEYSDVKWYCIQCYYFAEAVRTVRVWNKSCIIWGNQKIGRKRMQQALFSG